jgi:hypothetical protein
MRVVKMEESRAHPRVQDGMLQVNFAPFYFLRDTSCRRGNQYYPEAKGGL